MYFTTLILSGGGIKGIAMSSALEQLENNNYLKNIKKIVGCSIGAFIASLLCLGYSVKRVNILINKVNLSVFQDINAKLFLSEFGFDNGDKFIKFVEACISYQELDHNITLRELYKKSKYELVIVASNINNSSAEYFSYKTFPDLKLTDALRASAGYPFAFVPTKIGDNWYTDGGITSPFPTEILSKSEMKKKALGIVLFHVDQKYDINSLDKYIFAIISCMINSLTLWNIKQIKHKIIISHEIPSMNFDITDEIKKELNEIGSIKAHEFIDKINKVNVK